MRIIVVPLLTAALFLSIPAVLPATQTCRTADLPLTAPDGRFRVNANGTVQDKATGLVWKRCSEGQEGDSCESGKAVTHTWDDAMAVARGSVFAGEKGWRLPTLGELATLLEYQCTMPSINLRVFPGTPASNFWSSTPYAGYLNGSWNINFNDGVHDNSSRNYRLYVRLVRGGAAATGEGK